MLEESWAFAGQFMDNIFDEYMENFDHLGQSFFKHISDFKDLEKNPENLKLGGPADIALSEAIKNRMMFEEALGDLKKLKMPFFGGAEKKAIKKKMLEQSKINLFQMMRAMEGIDKSFIDGAMNLLIIERFKNVVKK